MFTYDMTKEQLEAFIKDRRGLVEIRCKHCGGKFTRKKSDVIKGLAKNRHGLFCSYVCSNLAKVHPVEEQVCPTCNSTFLPKETEQVYCSRSCAAKINNVKFPKRGNGNKLKPKACDCGNLMKYDSVKCRACHMKTKKMRALEAYLEKTIGEFKLKHKQKNNAWHHFSIGVRSKSRDIADVLYGMEKRCSVCGYDTYVELCHIQPIASFPDEATMAEVNAKENLVYLCPNHHKELDLGLLKVNISSN